MVVCDNFQISCACFLLFLFVICVFGLFVADYAWQLDSMFVFVTIGVGAWMCVLHCNVNMAVV